MVTPESVKSGIAAGLQCEHVEVIGVTAGRIITERLALHLPAHGGVAEADPTSVTPEQLGSAMTGAGLDGSEAHAEGDSGAEGTNRDESEGGA